MLEDNERNYWLGFSAFSQIGPARFKKLLAEFETAKNAWEAAKSDLARLIEQEIPEKFDSFRRKFSIDNYLEQLKRKAVWFVTLQDKDYPQILKEIKNPPFVLYGKGDPSTHFVRSGPSVAVVGTRRTTQYGREVTKLLTQELVANGFVIVSGLALGVDAISHMTALENNGSPSGEATPKAGEAGKTIAVLGCGVDCCFPIENQSIYNSIVKNGGLIVSEYPLGMKPARWTFPARNRIIAGLSQAVLVTEGAEDSGSLITAGYALKFGRKVFAVPGPITSTMSKGPYKLIAKGAKLVTSAEDILKELAIRNYELGSIKGRKGIKSIKGETKEERMILEILQNEPLYFDEIVRRTGFDSSRTGSLLSLMEIKGFVKGLDGGQFGIAS